ncbi:hypothetical protein KA005_33755 [bacterium]|nr:hypothetical protein [bacterium]
MFPHISRSTFGKENEELYQNLEKYLDKPTDFVKDLQKRARELRPQAEKIRVMIETPGWKEIIGPFLESQANPGRVFKIVKSDKDERKQLLELAKSEAFYNLSVLINNFLSILNIPIEEEKKEEKPEEEEEVIEDEIIDRER